MSLSITEQMRKLPGGCCTDREPDYRISFEDGSEYPVCSTCLHMTREHPTYGKVKIWQVGATKMICLRCGADCIKSLYCTSCYTKVKKKT